LNAVDFLLNSYKEPYFYIGIVVCYFAVLLNRLRKEDRKKQETFSLCSAADKLINAVTNNERIALENFFPWTVGRKDDTTVGYAAWKALAYWLAAKYSNYEFSGQAVTDFWNTASACFGESAAFIKMQALDEIINRSTKYYADDGRPIQRKEDRDTTELFKMVDLIVDSFAPEVYEWGRADKER